GISGLPRPDGPSEEYDNAPPSNNNWRNWRNTWYASYSFVFGLTTTNRSSRPVPMISDRGIYYKGDITGYSNLSGCNPLTGNHNAGINTLYLDGSVQWVNLSDIDFSIDKDDGSPYMGNVAARPAGYSVDINDDDEKDAWGE
ncbi:MAG: hypothetical protein PHI44_02035, partial [Candidatus Ratteibacteria bacterium]|nr:hypothetical protein [Candidatus Ratteibacteria bacterium]